MAVDHLLHVAVLLLDVEPVGRARKVLHHPFDDALKQGLLLPQSLIGEVAHNETQRGLLKRAGDGDRMQKALLAFGGFRRTGIFRQAIDDGRGDLDRVLHLAFGKTGMGADAFDGDGG